MPACLPEQLLQTGVSAIPWRATSLATVAPSGTCVPHARSLSAHPIFPRKRRTISRCTGSLECEAQVSASSSAPSPKRSAPPSATSGIAWNGLAAERQNVVSDGSPAWATVRPASSTTASETRNTDSTSSPRVDSTRKSFIAEQDKAAQRSSHLQLLAPPGG